MRKFIVFLILTVSLIADTVMITGFYKTDGRKLKTKNSIGFPGGCIFQGETHPGQVIKVYTQNICDIISLYGIKINGIFICEINIETISRNIKNELMFEGVCKEKD